MNFYKHHLGDYSAATAHLSWDEDCAYRRLIEQYYKREAPLPAEIKECCRLARAISAGQRRAVESVLREFFVKTDEGWRQKRCDAELAEADEQGGEREAKADNERERQRRHREERKKLFQRLRENDIVPPWDTKTDALRAMLAAQHVTAGTRDESQNVTLDVTPVAEPVTRTATANQTPDSRLHLSEANASAADASPLTAKERIWLVGVALLGEKGRGFIGKAIATYGEAAVLGVLVEATTEKPIDPKAWTTAALEARSKSNGHSHHEPDDMLADPKPSWAIQAGFPDRFQAENAGCLAYNAHKFSRGQRISA